MPRKKKDEYAMIWDNGDDAGFDYREPDDTGDLDDRPSLFPDPWKRKSKDEYEEIWKPEMDMNDDVLTGDCPICGGFNTISGKDFFLTCKSCGNVINKSTYSLFLNGILSKDEVLEDLGLK